ncbi:signal peptidase I [Hyalangium minutum]|uniref:Signal peptidase I n=1 Tax=Hyalangium minutum TaxID=394096 RepID=A0A085WRR4_9BACT|nr:signal peptidase I [Hyalangium minutum]KFE70377.1 Signal peptidase I [Hyalangium minutum]
MTAATTPVKLAEALSARRTPEQLRARRVLMWRQLLTSLWAPLTLVGLLFIPYLFVIESSRAAASWAKPAMQFFGAAMFFYWLGLLGWRLASKREQALRKLRHEARELFHEAERIFQRLPDKLPPNAAEGLTEQSIRVEDASIAADVPRLEKEVRALDKLHEDLFGAYRKQSGWETVSGFGKALAIALLIRTIFIEPYRIPSGSMLPTLEIGDQVFVNKFVYGVRIPFINKVPFQFIRAPMRGDVIVFNNPIETDKDFIKRVVGLPGDKIEVIDEVIHVNGVPQQRRLVSSDFIARNLSPRGEWYDDPSALYEEQLGEVAHAVLQDPSHPHGHVTEGPFVVPEDHVFVMGDNRDNSSDSRVGFVGMGHPPAYVPYGNIKGKAMVVWLSLGYGGLFSGFFDGTGLRLDRFFEPVR